MKQKESKVYGGHQVNSYLPLVSYRGQNRLKDNGLNLIMLIIRQWLNNSSWPVIEKLASNQSNFGSFGLDPMKVLTC